MKGLLLALRAAVGAAALAALPVHADLVTSPADLPVTPFAFTLDFDGPTGSNLTSPVVLGRGVTFSTFGAKGLLGLAPLGTWLLGPDIGEGNGQWSGDRTFAAVDGDLAPDGSVVEMRFSFDKPVQGVGGFMNFDPSYTYGDGSFEFPLPLYIAALGTDGGLLEGREVPVSTPDRFNEGAFYGIGRGSADIATFVISGPFAVVDDLQVSAVPEPSTWAMMLAGLALLGHSAQRSRRR